LDKVTFIKHKGKDIIITNLADTANVEEQLPILTKAEETIKTQPFNSVRSLIDYTNARYDLHSVEAQKNFSTSVTPYMKASAVVGLSGLMKVILRSIVRITGRNIRDFENIESAKDWLSEQ